MRNLKRALSLTLASVMLLGMMVVGASAKGYDDVKETDNVEAIEVLQAIEVMVGDERGFGPDRPVNRAEMAVVMALLLNLDYNYYSTSCPFNDVYDWARGYVGACAANKIVSGRGEGIYDPGATVTAVEAASMLMRALGYFQYQNDYQDGFELSTVRQGTKIGIFDGVGSSATEPMTRNQVAQMVLNALQSAVVEPDGNTINLTTPEGQVYTGKVNYVSVTSSKPFATAISRTTATSVGSQNDGYIVELGERLYDGKLKLNDDQIDDFGRPSRLWEFDGKEIGTYMKKELIRQEWSVKVTGKMLYDLLTKGTLEDRNYKFYIYVDGETTSGVLGDAYFTTADLNKNNNDKVGATGNGVLTQVFVDSDEKEVTIAVINTYLAKANADYSDKKDEVSFKVWGIDNKSTPSAPVYVKTLTANKDDYENIPVAGEDFSIKDVKEGDAYLVNVASGEIQIMKPADVISAATLSAFSKGNYVVSDGTQYDYAQAIEYDPEVLEQWTNSVINLKDREYNLYLDTYGYVLGVDLVEAIDNYLFITGIDDGTSNLAATNFKANAIFLDGTMKTIEISGKKSNFGPNTEVDPLVNRWFTYTVNKDVYSVDEVNDVITNGTASTYAASTRINGLANSAGTKAVKTNSNGKIAQFATKDVDTSTNHATWANAWAADTTTKYDIDVKHVSLPAIGVNGKSGVSGSSAFARVYGNNDTVYISAEVETINAKNRHIQAGVISGVNSVTTGVKDASLKTYNLAEAKAEADKNGKVKGSEKATDAAYGAYTLYKNNGYIIATVVVGEDSVSNKNLVYAHTGDVKMEAYTTADDQWTWTREVIFNGEKTEIKEVGDKLQHLDDMEKFNWYQVKFNAKNEVISVELAETALGHTALGSGNEYVDDIELVETAINKKDSVLYEESAYLNETPVASAKPNEVTDAKGPNLIGQTFYVRTDDKTGFYVTEDVKVVFIQARNNETKTYIDSGVRYLEDVIDDLNKENNLFHYECSAILTNGQATVVVIHDMNGDGYAPGEIATDHVVTAEYDGFHTFTITISDTCVPNYPEIADAIKKELEGKDWNATDVTVTFDTAGITKVTFKTAVGVPVTLEKGTGLTIDVVKSFMLNGETKVVDFSSYVAGTTDVANLIDDGEGGSYDADTTLAATPYSKVVFQNPKTGAKRTAYMALSDTLNATELVTLVSIDTGYVTNNGMKAEETQEIVDEIEISGGPLAEDAGTINSLGDRWMKPDANLNVVPDNDSNIVTISGNIAMSGANDFTGTPWFFTSGEGTTANHFLAIVSLPKPTGDGIPTALYAKRVSDGKVYTVASNSEGLSVALLVPYNSATGKATAPSNLEFAWYADAACKVLLGTVQYSFDVSGVNVSYTT